MGRSIYYGQKSHIAYSTRDNLGALTEVVADPTTITDITDHSQALKSADLTRLAQVTSIQTDLNPDQEEIIYPFSYKKISKIDARIGKTRKIDLRYTIVQFAEILLDHNDLLNTFLQPVLPWSVVNFAIYNSQIYDTLNLSNLEIRGATTIASNDFLEGITFNPSIGYAYMTSLNLSNNKQLRYVDFKDLHGMLTPANSQINIKDIGSSTAQIDLMLEEINLRVYSGNPGRVFDMTGAFMAAPSAAGIVFKNKILAKGIDIRTNNP